MKQSRKMSLAESIVNVLIGYTVAVCAQLAVFPLFGIDATFADSLGVGAIFTVVSIIRSYFVRRLFEGSRDIFPTIKEYGR